MISNVTYVMQTKQTPLHLAAENGQLEVCETLLQLGADFNATTEEGKKAVHLAALHNHSEVVKHFFKMSPELVATADKVMYRTGEFILIFFKEDPLIRFCEQIVRIYHGGQTLG